MEQKIKKFLTKMRDEGKSAIVLTTDGTSEEIYSDAFTEDALRLNVTLSYTLIEMLQRQYRISFKEAKILFLEGMEKSLKKSDREFSDLSA